MEESGGVLEVGVYEQDNRIVLDIIDMGIGISDEDMEKIFHLTIPPREQGDRTRFKGFQIHI